jgi:hypothetical protein
MIFEGRLHPVIVFNSAQCHFWHFTTTFNCHDMEAIKVYTDIEFLTFDQSEINFWYIRTRMEAIDTSIIAALYVTVGTD